MPCTSTSAPGTPLPGTTSSAGSAVMNGSSRKICAACRMRRQTALAKNGCTSLKRSFSDRFLSSSSASIWRCTSAARSGAELSNGTLCIKAWMAVPRSAPVRPDFCINAGRSSATGLAAWVTALTLTLAGIVSSAARGLRHAKLCRSTRANSASGAAGSTCGCSVSASCPVYTRIVSGTRVGRVCGSIPVMSHSAWLSGCSSAAVISHAPQLLILCSISGVAASVWAQSAGSLVPDAAAMGAVMISASCARVSATYKMRISSLTVSARMAWVSAA